MKTNPWKKIKSVEVYRDPWIRVRVDDVIRPDGKPGNYSVVGLKGGVGVVVFDDENKILLVGQYRYPLNSYSWEIPKGAFDRFDSEEDPLGAAKRELKEETGVTASNWRELVMVHTLVGSTNDKVYLFAATIESQGNTKLDATEVIEKKWVSQEEFWKMVKKGEVTDATTIAGVVLGLWWCRF